VIMSTLIKKISALLAAAFAVKPASGKRGRHLRAAGGKPAHIKRFNWQGIGAGTPGRRNGFGTRGGPGF